jgi:hypothetical protein
VKLARILPGEILEGSVRFSLKQGTVYLMLSQEDKLRIRFDFIEWSGGFDVSEVEPETIDLYVEVAMPDYLEPAEVEEYLSEWSNETVYF